MIGLVGVLPVAVPDTTVVTAAPSRETARVTVPDPVACNLTVCQLPAVRVASGMVPNEVKRFAEKS